ncbi:hypothetical protein BJX66DRAFT_314557 [Aspergillus keveii]|uniref:Uncharacterized protein n=1 Tax=Aspergillus keveii TaxID=714993 RepID=A0ABR4FRB0_9EURO
MTVGLLSQLGPSKQRDAELRRMYRRGRRGYLSIGSETNRWALEDQRFLEALYTLRYWKRPLGFPAVATRPP